MMYHKDDWMNRKWRPAMGWTYMITCITDFIVFPILWSILQAGQDGQVTSQWAPITLQGGGLFHLAMGAVLGVAAWSRGREKMAGVSSGYPMYPPHQMYQQEYEYESQTPTSPKRTDRKKPEQEEPPEL
jgi:hypothetical protein